MPQWSLDNGYYYVVGYDGPWKALPEPSTYGAVFVAAGLGVAFLRRRGRGPR
ncbi:PEP-CTERM sorting domain-containing protein [Cephaloticoccus primus]|uniref:PEP-CTERM sorting domain-containing protein n=1 Tax=Cephaloticoccus primus TaxID=1548207 RepID=UPI0034E0D5EE